MFDLLVALAIDGDRHRSYQRHVHDAAESGHRRQAFGWDGCERMSAFRAMSRMGSGRDA